MGIAHRATKNTELMGYSIAKNTIVLTNLYSVHMDGKVWQNPEEFRPERFLDRDGNISVDENHYIPFGLGERFSIYVVYNKRAAKYNSKVIDEFVDTQLQKSVFTIVSGIFIELLV